VLILVIPPFLAAVFMLASTSRQTFNMHVPEDLPTFIPIGFEVALIGMVSEHPELKRRTNQ
jgi:hypothetical protein